MSEVSVDYQAMDEAEFEAHKVAVRVEWDRREILAHAPGRAEQVRTTQAERLDEIAGAYLRATGREPGRPWQAPSSAVDAYPEGWTVTHPGVDGDLYESRHAGNDTEPGTDPARRWWANLTTPAPEPTPEEPTVWAPGVTYVGPNTRPDQPGDLVTDETGETAWRCKQTHASQAGWAPWDPGTHALWEKVPTDGA